MSGAINPTTEQIARLSAGPPDDGPIVMLNLLRFRAEAAPVDGTQGLSGREAYDRYATEVASHLAAAGGRVLNAGQCVETVIGADGEWDVVALVEYPSRGAFLAMVSDPDYLAKSAWRTAALADSRLILCDPQFAADAG